MPSSPLRTCFFASLGLLTPSAALAAPPSFQPPTTVISIPLANPTVALSRGPSGEVLLAYSAPVSKESGNDWRIHTMTGRWQGGSFVWGPASDVPQQGPGYKEPELGVFVDDAGKQYLVKRSYLAGSGVPAKIILHERASGADPWAPGVEVTNGSAEVASPTVLVDGSGALHVGWSQAAMKCSGGATHNNAWYRRRPAPGAPFDPPQNLFPLDCGYSYGAGWINLTRASGKIHYVWQDDQASTQYMINARLSPDHGQSWSPALPSPPQTLFTNGYAKNLAVSNDWGRSQILAVWRGATGQPAEVPLMVASWADGAWSAAQVSSLHAGSPPSVTSGPEGYWVLTSGPEAQVIGGVEDHTFSVGRWNGAALDDETAVIGKNGHKKVGGQVVRDVRGGLHVLWTEYDNNGADKLLRHAVASLCTPADPVNFTEACNGQDDNCDGQVDEGCAGAGGSGQGGSAQAGSGGSAQAGSGGSAQAGSSQAGSAGSEQAGSAQAGSAGSDQAGSGGSAGQAGGASGQGGLGGSGASGQWGTSGSGPHGGDGGGPGGSGGASGKGSGQSKLGGENEQSSDEGGCASAPGGGGGARAWGLLAALLAGLRWRSPRRCRR